MLNRYKRYVPRTISEVMDLIGSMTLDAPQFVDNDGYSPGMSIDSEFEALNEGFKLVRKRIGEENYVKLVELSATARRHFEADPEDATEDGTKGRKCLFDMENILKSAAKRPFGVRQNPV